jgi:hypothetical protein
MTFNGEEHVFLVTGELNELYFLAVKGLARYAFT